MPNAEGDVTVGEIAERFLAARLTDGPAAIAALNELFAAFPRDPDGLRLTEYLKLQADVRGLCVAIADKLTTRETRQAAIDAVFDKIGG